MVYRDVFVSNNGKYLAGLSNLDTTKDTADVTVYETENFSEINSFKKVPYYIAGRRCAISDDGKYVVTSSYYKRKGMVLFNTQTGKRMWTNKDYTKIQVLQFSKDSQYIIVITATGSVYYISIETGEKLKTLNGKEFYENTYGADIFIHDKKAKVGEITIESPSFGYITALGTKDCVVLSPVTKGLYVYHYDGTLLWENNPQGILHFLKLSYDEENEIVYGIAPEAVISFSLVDGTIIDRLDFDVIRSGNSSEFINEGNYVLGADKKIYNLEKGKIILSSQKAPFDIGFTLESFVEKSTKQFGDEVQAETSDYDEASLQLVPKNLQKLYRQYRKIVVPYLQVYSIEEALDVTEKNAIREKGYFIFGYGESCGYLLCALDSNPQEHFFVCSPNIQDAIDTDVLYCNDILSSFLSNLKDD